MRLSSKKGRESRKLLSLFNYEGSQARSSSSGERILRGRGHMVLWSYMSQDASNDPPHGLI